MKFAATAALVAAIACPLPLLAADAAPAQIVTARSGVFEPLPDGGMAFRESETVSLRKKESYGWMMEVNTDHPTVRWREEFTLPAPAKVWGVEGVDDIAVDPNAKVAVTEREVEPIDGMISNIWDVAQGDPKGLYTMKVTVDGAESRAFTFQVR